MLENTASLSPLRAGQTQKQMIDEIKIERDQLVGRSLSNFHYWHLKEAFLSWALDDLEFLVPFHSDSCKIYVLSHLSLGSSFKVPPTPSLRPDRNTCVPPPLHHPPLFTKILVLPLYCTKISPMRLKEEQHQLLERLTYSLTSSCPLREPDITSNKTQTTPEGQEQTHKLHTANSGLRRFIVAEQMNHRKGRKERGVDTPLNIENCTHPNQRMFDLKSVYIHNIAKEGRMQQQYILAINRERKNLNLLQRKSKLAELIAKEEKMFEERREEISKKSLNTIDIHVFASECKRLERERLDRELELKLYHQWRATQPNFREEEPSSGGEPEAISDEEETPGLRSYSHQQGINNKREFEHHIQKENANSLELMDMQQHMIETYEKLLKLEDDQSKILRENNPILNTKWLEENQPHNNKKLMKALYLQHQWYDTPSSLVPRAVAHFACPLRWPYHNVILLTALARILFAKYEGRSFFSDLTTWDDNVIGNSCCPLDKWSVCPPCMPTPLPNELLSTELLDRKLEQIANIKFCVLLGKSGTENFPMMQQSYGNEAISRAEVGTKKDFVDATPATINWLCYHHQQQQQRFQACGCVRPRYPPSDFSSLKLLRSYMRNSTNDDRLNELHVHTSRGVSYGPMCKNARSGSELELARSGNARFAPDLPQFWPDLIFSHGDDEVLNELSMKPRKINIKLKRGGGLYAGRGELEEENKEVSWDMK
uniref:(California timema) hypothetical protein n=1 Tax=Timema californicum TaxID=61474 RepID=A0A7R9J018_TIMCA|nr:unnamed protein product [Timema californicum]